MGSCIPVDRGRRYRDRAGRDNDTASLQATSECQSPMGAMGKYRSLRHIHKAIVDQSVGRSCASESRGKHVSHFPIGAMGNSQVSAARTYPWWNKRLITIARRESRQEASTSAIFPLGRWELFKVSAARTTCSYRSVRSCASVSRGKHVSNFPIGGKF